MSRVRFVATTSLLLTLAACSGDLGGGDTGADAAPRPEDAGDSGLLDYIPSNMPPGHIMVGTAIVEISGDVTINTDTGTVLDDLGNSALPADSIFVVVAQQAPGAPELGVFSWASLTIADGVSVTVEGQNALVFGLSAHATIGGTIDLLGGRTVPTAPGPGGFAGGDDDSRDGAGPGGGLFEGDYDAGGGGGGYAAAGGAGGTQEGRAGGAAGASYGDPINDPLLGGSGGARGGGGGNNDPGTGGGGGGAFQISARGDITLTPASVVNVGGGGGEGGDDDKGGGGGAAGGAILIEGRSVSVAGVLAANGGGGGAGANGNSKGDDGMPGQAGPAIARGGEEGGPDSSSGGDGAAGDVQAGAPGLPTTGNSGGGGGAGGRIFLRSREPVLTPGSISPTPSLTLGVL